MVGDARGSEFVGTMDERGAEATVAGGNEIDGMGGAHHRFFGLQFQQTHCGEVGFPIRFVMLGEFGGKDEVPRETGVFRHSGEERDVAV